MSTPRFAIGIDLGTTNCALAYVDLRHGDGLPQILSVPQLESLDRVTQAPLLPSCFYYATEAEASHGWTEPLGSNGHSVEMGFVVGTLARERMAELPGRVIHSAKSWLAHAGVDREAQILPFASDEIAQALRLSPAEASAAYLDYLKQAWDAAFAQDDPDNAFVRQAVVITVPASFDEGAQALTRKAAELAGYPRNVRLLEEPQAAFYAWLAGHSLQDSLPALAAAPQTVLVCDVGGGTSDFSLFRIAEASSGPDKSEIERIATSDHLLLGGDNIDLALAHALEQQFMAGQESRLTRHQWQHLLPQARALKERALAEAANTDDVVLQVALPGAGGGLFAGAMSASLTAPQVLGIVLAGFYPEVPAEARPRLRAGGLREMGLPYAADSAITRHLAAFVGGRKIDAVLFVGGSLQPDRVRTRLLGLIGAWQGVAPTELHLADMNLAVAQGAARYAAIRADIRADEQTQTRIKSGYPRSVHLELQTEGGAPKLVCVLPQGTPEGSRLALESPVFDLLVNQPVRFSAWTSREHKDSVAGSLADLDYGSFHALPPLFASIVVDQLAPALRKGAAQHIKVHVEVTLSELGVLHLALVSAGLSQHWELEFNLRQTVSTNKPEPGHEAGEGADTSAVAEASAIELAQERIALFFGKKQALDVQSNVKTLPKDLEKILGAGREDWSLPTLRALWPALQQGLTRRSRSLAHENMWLNLAGFALRPGYGSDLDPWRMAQLWECHELGLAHPKEKSALSAWWIMWRRTAGGLPQEQQEILFDAAHPLFMQTPAESVENLRLMGCLERVQLERREDLADRLVYLIGKGRAEKQPHVFWTLSRLLSRIPLYASADAVLPASLVEAAFMQMENLDWRTHALQPLIGAFSSACRRTEMRMLDIDDEVRSRVLVKLRQSGAKAEQIRVVHEYCEVTKADRNALFGEELPSGLRVAAA